MMEDGKYWQLRASEMRERASRIKDPFISGGFLALAQQYEQLVASDARSSSRAHPAPDSEKLRAPASVMNAEGLHS